MIPTGPGFLLKMGVRDSVIDDGDMSFRIIKLRDDLTLNHLRIRNHAIGFLFREKALLQFHQLVVFAVHEAERFTPLGLKCFPFLEPDPVHAVAGAIAVTFGDPLKTE